MAFAVIACVASLLMILAAGFVAIKFWGGFRGDDKASNRYEEQLQSPSKQDSQGRMTSTAPGSDISYPAARSADNGSNSRRENSASPATSVQNTRQRPGLAEPRRAISEPLGKQHIVTTQKMSLREGLFLSVSFIILDPDAPQSYELDGLAGVVTLENLVTTRNHQLVKANSVGHCSRRIDRL